MSSVIRRAQSSDLPALVHLEHAAFRTDQLSRRSLRYFLNSDKCDFFVLTENSMDLSCEPTHPAALLGYFINLYRAGSQGARLYSIAIQSASRGRGHGLKLAQAAIYAAAQRNCDFIYLEVGTTNQTAQLMYQKLGFKPKGLLQAYYADGEAALKMHLNLRSKS